VRLPYVRSCPTFLQTVPFLLFTYMFILLAPFERGYKFPFQSIIAHIPRLDSDGHISLFLPGCFSSPRIIPAIRVPRPLHTRHFEACHIPPGTPHIRHLIHFTPTCHLPTHMLHLATLLFSLVFFFCLFFFFLLFLETLSPSMSPPFPPHSFIAPPRRGCYGSPFNMMLCLRQRPVFYYSATEGIAMTSCSVYPPPHHSCLLLPFSPSIPPIWKFFLMTRSLPIGVLFKSFLPAYGKRGVARILK